MNKQIIGYIFGFGMMLLLMIGSYGVGRMQSVNEVANACNQFLQDNCSPDPFYGFPEYQYNPESEQGKPYISIAEHHTGTVENESNA